MSRPDRLRSGDVPEPVRADLFASERRCRILRGLATADGTVSVSDLAARLQGESDEDVETIRYEVYDRHLPKLAATGVVEYHSRLDKLVLLDTEAARTATRRLEG